MKKKCIYCENPAKHLYEICDKCLQKEIEKIAQEIEKENKIWSDKNESRKMDEWNRETGIENP